VEHRTGSNASAHTLPVAVLLIGGLVYWSPILVDPAGRIAGGNGDPLFLAYIVTWVAGHFGDAALWNPPFFHPATGVLAYSDHLFGLSAAAWPLVAAGASPIFVINLLAILASVLTSVALYIWLRDSGFSTVGAGAAALTVTYSAWRHLQIIHPQLQWLAFLPIALLCYGRAIEGRTGVAWIWAGGAALALQTLFTPSLGVSLMPLATIWLITASLLARRKSLAYWVSVGGSIAVVGLVNLPIAVHYWRAGDTLDRTTAEIALHSAAWIDWISAQHHWLYGNALRFTRGSERELFAGFGWMAVAGIGVVATLRVAKPLPLAGLLTAAVAFWATTGVSIEGSGWAGLPYDLFRRFVPGGGQVRVPVRLVLLAAVFLAPAVAAGWTSVYAAVARRLPALAAQLVAFLLAGAVVAEGLASVAWFERAWAEPVGRLPVAAGSHGVLMVPLGEAAGTRREIARMWSARRAGVPIVNGYSGNDSPLYRRLRDLQAAAPDPAVQRALYALLHRFGVTTIVADRPVPSMIDESTLLQVAPGVFRIPDAVARVRVDRFEMGRGAALILTDSGWSYPEHNDHESWVWSVQRRATLRVPLGGVPRLLARSQSSEGDELELWWNGRRLGVQPLEETPKLHSFRLLEASSVADWIDVEVRGPVPVRLPGNPDPRALGVCVFEIRLE
jgi:hypothetical protein